MEDDPASRLLHRSYLMASDPSQRTAFPGDFAEFLSRSYLPSGSNYRTRHPALIDPSPKLLFSFYRRSDKVWGMTLPPDFCSAATLRSTILPGELHFRAILQNSYQDRPCRVAASTELGTQLWRRSSDRVWLPFQIPACTTLYGARTAQVWTVLRSARRIMDNVAKELDGAGVGIRSESTPPPLHDGSKEREKDGPAPASLIGRC